MNLPQLNLRKLKLIKLATRALLLTATLTGIAYGQSANPCTDPWVSQSVQEVKGIVNGSLNAGDCANANYGGGHWSSYPDLKAKVLAYFVAHPNLVPGPCADPWVTLAVRADQNRVNGSGAAGDCNAANYGGGHWSGWPDLQTKVNLHFHPPAPVPVAPAIPPQSGALRPQPQLPNPHLVTRLNPAKCLGVENGTFQGKATAQRGQRIISWDCQNTYPDQKFNFGSTGQVLLFDGALFSIPGLTNQDRYCLDDNGGRLQDGDQILAWPCSQSTSRWTRTPAGQFSQNGMCVELRTGVFVGNQDAILRRCDTGVAAQIFDAR